MDDRSVINLCASYLFQRALAGCTVALGGDGGTNSLPGYTRYWVTVWRNLRAHSRAVKRR